MVTVTGTTEVTTLTENNAVINRTREVVCTTESILITENAAGVNGRRIVGSTVEIVLIATSFAAVKYDQIVETSFNMVDTFGSIGQTTELQTTMQINTPITLGTELSLIDNSFSITDFLSVIWTPVPLSDSFNMSDTQELSTTAFLTSIINLVDSFGSIDQTTNLKTTLSITDTQSVVIIALLVDAFNMSDTQELATIANLVSNFNINDILTGSLDSNAELVSSFNMRDSQALGLAELLVSTGLFSSSTIDLRTQIELLTDSLTLTDVQVLSATVKEELASTMQFNEVLSFKGSVYNLVLVSTIEMGSILWSPDFGAIAWVMNPETDSIAPYTNFDFNSLAEHNGRVFAVSSAGIYELIGDTDNGRQINAFAKGGFEDFGSPLRKRASDLYLSHTGGMLESAIETYDGPKTVYNYPIQERDSTAPRNNRMKVGRGLVSRYWRTEVRNLEGAAFKVFEIGLNTITSKRRL